MDPEGLEVSVEPILTCRQLVKRYGRVTALDHADFDLYPGEILAVIGDNGAGKSTLIKAICGAVIPDSGEIRLGGEVVNFTSPIAAREAGIETVYQTLALSPALSIADNMFLGREPRMPGFMGQWFRATDRGRMAKFAREKLNELGLMTIQNINQPVETLSGGQRQGVAVARAAAFAKRLVIMDEPTAALGVKESRRVLELILDVKKRGLPIILISHNMPHVFEVADRIHIHRLGRRLTVVDPKKVTMSDAVAMMTGAMAPPPGRRWRPEVAPSRHADAICAAGASAGYLRASPNFAASIGRRTHALSSARPHRPIRLGNLPRRDDLQRRRRVLAGDRPARPGRLDRARRPRTRSRRQFHRHRQRLFRRPVGSAARAGFARPRRRSART